MTEVNFLTYSQSDHYSEALKRPTQLQNQFHSLFFTFLNVARQAKKVLPRSLY
jgi:hypothetical protein